MLVTKIWSMQPGKYFCLSTRPRGQAKGPLKNYWFEKYEFHLVAKKIRQLRDDFNVWFCAHGFNARRRHTDHAEVSHFLYADLDGMHPNACPIRPSMAVESSPGRYTGYWYVGQAIDWERDNQAWTQLIGADPGGWDPTQVLRVPTSYNHKYSNSPLVKSLWQTGTVYKLSEIRAKLPQPTSASARKEAKGAAAVFMKWEKIIPRIYIKGLISNKPTERDRSDWLWRVGGDLREKGVPTDDIFTLLWNSGNNKYRDRRNGEKYLRREIMKKLESRLHRKIKPKEADPDELFCESMAEVEEQEVDWMWENYVARGEVTIIEGDPGVGKSLLAQKFAVAVANGDGMPGDKRIGAKPEVVFFLDHENSKASVMKPRLSHNGLRNPQNIRQEEKSFSVDDTDTVEEVHKAIVKHNCGLVIFDTLMNYAGGANTHNSAETARMMGTFRDIAIKFHIPVVVIRHLTKDSKTKAGYRGQGSITFTGTARTVIGVGYAGDDPAGRLFKVTKSNLTDVGGMKAYRFSLITEGKRVRVNFDGSVYVTDEELLNTPRCKPVDESPIIEWMTETLKGKKKSMSALVLEGKPYGYDERMITSIAHKITKLGPMRRGEPTRVLSI